MGRQRLRSGSVVPAIRERHPPFPFPFRDSPAIWERRPPFPFPSRDSPAIRERHPPFPFPFCDFPAIRKRHPPFPFPFRDSPAIRERHPPFPFPFCDSPAIRERHPPFPFPFCDFPSSRVVKVCKSAADLHHKTEGQSHSLSGKAPCLSQRQSGMIKIEEESPSRWRPKWRTGNQRDAAG